MTSPARKPKRVPLAQELAIQMYKDMCFYRRFEERVGVAYTKRKFSGFCHLHIGQEALAAGVAHAIRDDDYMLSGYRSHTLALCKGISPEAVFAELFGKEMGCSKGKGGSMHMFSAERRFYGGHGIVGGQVPLAAGIGFKIRYRKEDSLCVCYLGDAATNQGAFHEALNMACTWDLPVIYIIENNRYGMGTDIRRTTSVDELYKRALAYDMDHSQLDGMNCVTVYEHMQKVVADVRKTKRPHLIDAETYRYRGHSVSDPATYRTKDEVKEYQDKRDPIKLITQFIIENKYADVEELKAWDTEAKDLVKQAEKVADEAPEPAPEAAMDHLWATNE